MTHDEFKDEAARLFGSDPMAWAFKCPNCGDVATVAEFKAAGASSRSPGQECIGRTLNDRGCNWAAYGLIRGPLVVSMPDGSEVYSFEFAR